MGCASRTFAGVQPARRCVSGEDRPCGTVQVMSLIIDTDKDYEDGVPTTLERWIKSDMGALDSAFDAAWDGILRQRPKEGGK